VVHRLAAGGRIGVEERVELAETAHPAPATEPPGPGAQPSDVLGWVPQVGELPVEHATQTGVVDEEVAHSEISVDHDRSAHVRTMVVQPSHAQFEDRPCRTQRIEKLERVAQRIGAGETVDRRRVDGVDGGQGGRRLVGQRRSCAGELVAKDATGNGLPLEALDHQPAAGQPVGGTGGHHAGHRDPGRGRRPQEVRFHVGPGPLRQTVPPHLLEDEASHRPGLGLELERAGQARRTTREPAHRRDSST